VSGRHEGLAQSVQTRLVRHAKAIGADPNLVLARYGMERFLYRLSRSAHAERFVLKGALLLLAWLGEMLRPTRDADLLGYGDLSDETLLGIFREICAVEVEPDAVTFLPDSVAVAPIREQDAYGGRRVTLQARLGAARLTIQVDIGIGDAITPDPQWLEYPALLDAPRARLRAYPRETVIAEKLHAMVLFGVRSSRMKDYFDVQALLREQATDPETLARAIAATFARRRTALPDGVPSGLSDEFANDVQRRAQWQAFATRSRVAAPPLAEVVADIRERLAATIARVRQLRAAE
jgi:predicted nucleotidyltransferase component of viral defense system